MKALKSKIVGKSLSCINYDNDSAYLLFSDGSGIRIFSETSISMIMPENMKRITEILYNADFVDLNFDDGSYVQISLDDNFSGAEYFVFHDVDGSEIVHN